MDPEIIVHEHCGESGAIGAASKRAGCTGMATGRGSSASTRCAGSLFTKHAKKKLDVIFFPMIDKLHTALVNLQGSNACPTVTVTPETAKAAFTKEADVFAEQGIAYLDPLIDFSDRKLLGQQLFQALEPVLGLSPDENAARGRTTTTRD